MKLPLSTTFEIGVFIGGKDDHHLYLTGILAVLSTVIRFAGAPSVRLLYLVYHDSADSSNTAMPPMTNRSAQAVQLKLSRRTRILLDGT